MKLPIIILKLDMACKKNELMSVLVLFMIQANMAKLETSITLSGYRLEVKLSGFSEKLPVLAERIAANLKGIFVTSGNFEVRYVDLMKSLLLNRTPTY
jgi:secreted Zn-dependent insulinase-like peptidase